MWYSIVVVVLMAYLLGNINGSVCISTLTHHEDVRTHGSGNAGLTNFHRVFGGKLTLVVILSDMVKAILAVGFGLLAVWLGEDYLVDVALVYALLSFLTVVVISRIVVGRRRRQTEREKSRPASRGADGGRRGL